MRRWIRWVDTHINEPLAVRLTLTMGTMWVTYLFFLYGFIPIIWPHAEVTALYWSNTVQLWALPAIMVGQNVLSRASDRQAERQYHMVEQITELAAESQTMMAAQREMVTTLIHLSEAMTAMLARIEAKTVEIDAEVDALTERGGMTDAD